MTAPRRAAQQGFTLIEVMVALVIVAFGMGAVLASLSSAASNIAALHDKTLAQWIALNLVADARLNLQLPEAGVTEGDIKAFGNGDWHWLRDIEPLPAIPGLLEISVQVRRIGSSTTGSSSGGPGWSPGKSGWSGSSGISGGSSGSSSLSHGSAFGSSASGGGLGLSSGASAQLGAVSASISKLANSGKDQNWLASVIGFRGDAVAAASGEAPDWNGTSLGSSSSSSSSSSSGSGSILNPGTSNSSGGSSLINSGSGSGSSGGS